ncbi:MAG: orotidine-5'-phosphate decarboxylase [Deltaproteobacteria bacterium]|nr:orotidine-5'-phosphate decarboxylase [Deltaproteobacteria bacterium]
MFADKLFNAIKETDSRIVAGLDPRLSLIPNCILNEASKSATNEDAVYKAIVKFHQLAFRAMHEEIAAVKPNIAFFEQYGFAGVKAFQDVCLIAKDFDFLVIADAKRGDIGSTAQAYSNAFLGEANYNGKLQKTFEVDALTVNPFLGFDTLEPFLESCLEYDKGIFVLVKTSNPGSADIQNIICQDTEKTISEKIAHWISDNGKQLTGACGYSGLAAVVGATYPEEASHLRSIMQNNYFLIPGFGAQGGKAKDAIAGFDSKGQGAIVNTSRGLLGSFSSLDIDQDQIIDEIEDKLAEFNSQINSALSAV